MGQLSRMLGFLPKGRSVNHNETDVTPAKVYPDLMKIKRLNELVVTVPTGKGEVDIWTEECSALIDELVISRLTSANIASILAGLVSYQKTGVTSSVAHLAFVEAFNKSSGQFQEILHQGLFPRYNGEDDNIAVSPYFGSIDARTRAGVLDELTRNGYCVLPFTLKNDAVQSLNIAAQALSFDTYEPQSNDVPSVIEGIDPAKPPLCGGAYAKAEQITSCPVFNNLMHDPLIVELASAYLKTRVSPINALLWYSFPTPKASSELAQLFHYDLDTIRWLKVFYYLNDVGEENGPHEYVEASHTPGSKSQRLLERGYVRISDDDISQLQPGTVRSIVGRAGTVVLGDTRAFHKGRNVRSGYRLIYQPIYAASKVGYVQSA